MESYGGFKKLAIVALFFTAVTLIIYAPIVASLGEKVAGSLDDTYAILWQLWWYKHSILTLASDPSYSSYVEAPFGAVVTHATVVNHIFALPLTWAFGPVASFNIMTLASFILAGTGMYLLAMLVTGSLPAAVFAGLIYAFSPFHIVFSATGGMDGAQIQHLPFTLFFLLKYDTSGKTSDLIALALFFLLTVLSFGYYAVIMALCLIIYLIYTRACPRIFDESRGRGLIGSGPLPLLAGYSIISYLAVLVVINTFSEVAYPLRVLSLILMPAVAIYAGVQKTGIRHPTVLIERLKEMSRGKQVLLSASAIATLLAVFVFLLPVYSAASRNISDSYLVPYYSYLLPAPDHPLLGGLVPARFIPAQDPLVGKMVRIGFVFTTLALIGAWHVVKRPLGKARDLKKEFFAVLFLAGAALSLPPVVKAGDFSLYGPVYFLHAAIPPFVDVRRIVILLLLSGGVLASIGLCSLMSRISGAYLRGALYALFTVLLAIEFFPTLDVKDLGKMPAAYKALANIPGPIPIVEYPLTSIYDVRRYEPFYGQTIHEKPLLNPFGATGHEPSTSNAELIKVIEKGGAANEIFANTENAAKALANSGVGYVIVRTDKLGQGALPPEEGLTLAGRFDGSALYKVSAPKGGAYASFIDFYKGASFKNHLVQKDGRFVVDNPFTWADESYAYGRHWLWMSKGGGVRVHTDARDGSYDLVFWARSASKDAQLTVTTDGQMLGEFLVKPLPERFVIKGLKPHGAPLMMKLEVKNDDALVGSKGFPESGQGDGLKIGVGISGLSLIDSTDGSGKGGHAKGLVAGRLVEGIFAGDI